MHSLIKYHLFLFLAAISLGGNVVAQPQQASQAELAECANSAVDFVKRVHNARLDYSPESLIFVDRLVNDLHIKRVPYEKIENHLAVLSCYAGEVFARNLNGKWIYPQKEDNENLGAGPFVLLPKGILVNPLAKVLKIHENGLEDSVAKFYAVTKSIVKP